MQARSQQKIVLGLICWFALWPPHLVRAAQEVGHELRGKIFMQSNAPPNPPVRVQLIATGALQAQCITDSGGNYSFVRVRNGNYQVVIEGDGRTFDTTVVEVQIYFSSGNRNSQIVTRDIALLVKANSADLKLNSAEREVDASVPKDARKEYEKAIKSLKSSKTDEAIEHLNQAIKLYPKYYAAQLALGEEYAKKRDFSAARAVFEQAIESRPKASQAHLSLGIVLIKSGAHNDAILPLRQALEFGEQGSSAYLFLGIALMETNAFEEAEKMLLKAYDIGGSRQPGIRIYLANFYSRRGDPVKTLEQLEAYVKEAPTAANVGEIQQLIDKLRGQK